MSTKRTSELLIENKHYFVLFNENGEAPYISAYKEDLEYILKGWLESNGWKVKGPFELRLLEQ